MSRSEVSSVIPAALIELAAGRDPGPVTADDTMVATARDHRMAGLLFTHLQARGDAPMALGKVDLRIQAHQRRVWALLERCVREAAAIDLPVAVIKGVPAEQRYYGRTGERPCSDVDLLIDPDRLDRVPALVERLQPGHPWRDGLPRLVERDQVQSITLEVDELEVDVHLDVLKLGVRTRGAKDAWASTRQQTSPTGLSVRVLDDDWTLLLLLLHLNKDRFQRLLGYADIVRVMNCGDVDLQRVAELASQEGVRDVAGWSLDVVSADLALSVPRIDARTDGLRARLWHSLYRREIRLRGSEGRRSFRFRQNLLPVLGHGRTLESLRWWVREVLPPAAAVDARYSDLPGPYLLRLARGRFRAAASSRRPTP